MPERKEVNITKKLLAAHLYHNWKVVEYGSVNIALECLDCYEVIADYDCDVRKLVKKSENK